MKKIFIVSLAVLAVVFVSQSALAAQTKFHGLSVSPAIEQLTLGQNQSQLSYRIHLNNSLNQLVNVRVATLDFKSLNESGGVAFISNNASDIEHKYGLAKWINVPSELIKLPAGGGRDVNINIDNRSDLAPGGHYAAILFEIVSLDGNGTNHVEVDQVISSLLFMRKSGGEIYKLNLTKNTIHRNFAWFGWPTRLDTWFSNNGNVQTAPRGVITLAGTNRVLNPDSSLVLPGNTRLINTDLSSIKAPFWPGIYHLKLSYRPDASDSFKVASSSFIYIGWRFLVALAILIAAILAGLPHRTRKPIWRFSLKAVKRAFTGLQWVVITLARLVWKALIYIDTVLGRWLDSRSQKKSRRN